MKNQHLTYVSLILSWMLNPLELIHAKFYSQKSVEEKHSLEKRMRNADKKNMYSVSLFSTGKNRSVYKKLLFKYKNLKYRQLQNEAQMLKFLEGIKSKKKNVSFPRLINFYDGKDRIELEREFIEGVPLSKIGKEDQLTVLIICLRFINSEVTALLNKTETLPKRGYYYTLLTFFPVWLIALLKHPKEIISFSRICGMFYVEKLSNIRLRKAFVFSHRDLHSENILIQNKKTSVIDTEIALLTEPFTDLAIVARYYYKSLGKKRILSLIKSFTKNSVEVSSFKSLTIFYAVQCIAMENREDRFSKESLHYLKSFVLRNII